MQVSDLMTPDPVICTPEMTIQDAAKLMTERRIGAIPVVTSEEGRFLIGIITDRDLACRAVAHRRDADETTVRDCMSSPVATVTPDAPIEACAKLMESDQVRRVPVVDEHRKLVGIVAQADIARKAPEALVAEVLKDISEPSEMASRVPLAA